MGLRCRLGLKHFFFALSLALQSVWWPAQAQPLALSGIASPWNPANWLSCSATRCSGIRPDGLEVRLERRDGRFSPRQNATASLGSLSLTSTSERSPLTTASFAGPILMTAPTRSTTGTVFGSPLSIFTSSSGVVTGTYGDEPVLCAADGWGAPGNPSCF